MRLAPVYNNGFTPGAVSAPSSIRLLNSTWDSSGAIYLDIEAEYPGTAYNGGGASPGTAIAYIAAADLPVATTSAFGAVKNLPFSQHRGARARRDCVQMITNIWIFLYFNNVRANN
jgi:hypothetical protein